MSKGVGRALVWAVVGSVVLGMPAGGLLAQAAGKGAMPAEAAAWRDLPTEIWTVRHDNQTRRFAAAAKRAEGLLERDVGSVEQRCDLWLHLAFARQSLKREDAAEAFTGFVAAAKGLPVGNRLPLQMRLMRESLGLPALEGLKADVPVYSPPAKDSYWQLDAAEEPPYDAATIAELEQLAKRSGADGLFVAKAGRVVLEYYSPLYHEPMHTMSSCKSITGLLAGLLVDRGKLDIDAAVGEFLPEWREGARGKVTVRHLLTMTAGLPRRSKVERRQGDSWNDFARRQRVIRAPGAKWEYTNEGVQLLSPILEAAAGQPLDEFARESLFAPIGAVATSMRNLHGATNTFADARTTLREFARFGELVRLRGRWPGKGQVISEAWLDAMLAPCPRKADYGLLWWRERDGRGWSMRGYLDTDVWVFPALEVVVARVQQRAYLHVRETFDDERMYRLLSQPR